MGQVVPMRPADRRRSGHALDVYSQPAATLPTSAPTGLQTSPWRNFDDYSTHPGHGLEPRTVNAIFRGAEMGLLYRQADLFDDVIESDGHLRSVIEGRRDAVAGKEWVIQPGSDDEASKAAAVMLEKSLRDSLNFFEFVEHQLSAPYYGYACSEIEWGMSPDGVVPAWFHNVPHRRFLLGAGNELRLLTEKRETNGVELKPGKWVVSTRNHHNLARAGLMRTATWWALFKRMSVRDWVIFAERFGTPIAVGIYEDRAGEDARAALAEALRDLGNAGQVVISEATRIVFSEVAQRAGSTAGVHPAIVALCEAQMSKLVNGATANIETGPAGSYAQARVHETRAFSLELADAMRLAHVFRQHVGMPFVAYNGFPAGTAAPRLKIQVVRELDPRTRAEVASVLANELGAELDGAQLFDELGFRRPTQPKDALKGTKFKNAAPGSRSAPRNDDEAAPSQPEEPTP